MNALFEAAKEVCEFMDEQGWKYCIIGGLAVQRWGELRTTLDVDFSLFTDFGEEEIFADTLLERFSKRIPEAREHALKYRVLLTKASNGKSIDISFAGFPFEETIIDRATIFQFDENTALPTCSADDLFVMKIFAARDKDFHDAAGVAIRQPLNRKYILQLLEPLCEIKETPELVEKAISILEKYQ
jgi:hypothetical protein